MSVESGQRWMRKNREKWNAYQRERYNQNRDSILSYHRKWRRDKYNELRLRVLNALGNVCKRCGFDDARALQIDHRKGGGNQARILLHHTGIKFFQYVLKNKRKFQLLCANCNWIKRCENNECRIKKLTDT